MKRSEVKITVTLGDVFDAPLIDAWEQMCAKYGISEWCLREGADRNETIQISLEEAERWGIIEKD